MLEMGEPIKILDLAKKLIRLAGLREGIDAKIAITGLRPGEKLAEELTAPGEVTIPTSVEKINIVATGANDSVMDHVGPLLAGSEGFNDPAVVEQVQALLVRLIEGGNGAVADETEGSENQPEVAASSSGLMAGPAGRLPRSLPHLRR